jgi:hypothetical protein
MILAWLHRWQWLIAAVVAAIPTLYYGPRKLLETWDWYLNRFFDEAVMDVIRERRFVHAENKPPREEPYSVGDSARALKRGHPSIGNPSNDSRDRAGWNSIGAGSDQSSS